MTRRASYFFRIFALYYYFRIMHKSFLYSGLLLLTLSAASCGSHRVITVPQQIVSSRPVETKFVLSDISRSRILIDDRYDQNPDQQALDILAPYRHQVDSIMSPVVGHLAKDIAKDRPEAELNNLIADIMLWGGKEFNEKPDFSVYNVGGIRAALSKGNVTYGDVVDVAPFENKICFVTLTGDKVLELFRQIAHRGGECVSHGVKMVITKDGELVDVKLNGKPINPKKSYRISTIDYLAQGNDQLTAFKSGTNVLAPKDSKNDSRFVIMDYFREMMKKGIVVNPVKEGRIIIK